MTRNKVRAHTAGRRRGFLSRALFGLRRIGIRASEDFQEIAEDTDPQPREVHTEAALAYEGDKMVLAIEEELIDMPAWASIVRDTGAIRINTIGGEVVIANLSADSREIGEISRIRRLLLASNVNDNRVMHYLPFYAK